MIIGNMKKTVTILLLLSVMLSLSAATYYVGADGGMTANTVISGDGYRNYKYDARVGYRASLPVVVMFTDNLGLDTGIAVYGKYYNASQTVMNGIKSQENYNLNINNVFIELPLAFRASLPLGASFDAYFSVGGYLGWWIYGQRTGSVINMNEVKENVNEKTNLSYYNRLDAGASTKIGFGYSFSSFRAYVESECALSITDMNRSQTYGSFPIHNFTYAVTLGLLWRVK